jgi:hypothetical protein
MNDYAVYRDVVTEVVSELRNLGFPLLVGASRKSFPWKDGTDSAMPGGGPGP